MPIPRLIVPTLTSTSQRPSALITNSANCTKLRLLLAAHVAVEVGVDGPHLEASARSVCKTLHSVVVKSQRRLRADA
jgi:hypothetical protein